MARTLDDERGFTLAEMLVATVIVLVVLASVFALFNPALGAFRSQPEMAGVQQRLRLSVLDISNALLTAGAGTYRSTAAGPLTNVLAPVMPYRFGSQGSDPAQQVFFRSDTMTSLSVPAGAAESSVALAVTTPLADVVVRLDEACPPGVPACGFQAGDRVLIFDDGGSFDTFSVTGISGADGLQHANDALSQAYAAGARVVEIATDTVYLRMAGDGDNSQLMHYDGNRTEAALIDHIATLGFEYFGDPMPPTLIRASTEPVGPWTNYGPRPPAVGVDHAADTWPAGENCAFAVVGGQQQPRLPTLGAGSLVPLGQALLTDGPWCPDATSPNRFDADLLRVRTIRVTVRLRTGVAALRGAATRLFSRPGQGRDAASLVPDQEIRFDVAPRNLSLSR